jgi:hypothetical protein
MFLRSNNIDASLKDCKVFPDLDNETSCARGVFMEYAIGDTEHLINPKEATTGDIRDVCSKLIDDYLIMACSFYLPDRFLRLR